MSASNLAVVERAYDAMRRRDLEAFLQLTDPELEFTSLVTEIEGTVYRGQSGVRAYLDTILTTLPDWRPSIEHAEEHGDFVLVRLVIDATGAGSGVHSAQVVWQLVTLRVGRLLGWRFFRTEAEARSAMA